MRSNVVEMENVWNLQTQPPFIDISAVVKLDSLGKNAI